MHTAAIVHACVGAADRARLGNMVAHLFTIASVLMPARALHGERLQESSQLKVENLKILRRGQPLKVETIPLKTHIAPCPIVRGIAMCGCEALKAHDDCGDSPGCLGRSQEPGAWGPSR